MITFIDTSCLVKKYDLSQGSKELLAVLKKASKIFVSHITYLETVNTLQRRYSQKEMTFENLQAVTRKVQGDFSYFSIVPWNEGLRNPCIKLIQKYQLKTLDIIQVASGVFSEPEVFITSDKKQYQIAKCELSKVLLI